MAAGNSAKQNGRAGRMSDGKERWRAIRQHDLAHESFEIGIVVGKASHVAFAAIAQHALGETLAAPIERRHRKSARPQVTHGLEILFDPFAASLKDANGAAATRRRLPARIA